MSSDCRSKMEIEATKEVVRFLSGTPLKSEVPEREYSNQLLFRD
jgi:D-3-phosphoglycerate dehydrogenase